MKTPIFIDYQTSFPSDLLTNELNIYDEDPIDLYNDPTILDPLDTSNTLPYILAPRYYLEIHSPRNQSGPSFKVPIHKSSRSLLKDKVRIALKPSVGWGINASYKVDYWEWIPNVNLPAVPTKRKLSTEYWYVPTIDRDYVARFPFDVRSCLYPYDKWANLQYIKHPGQYYNYGIYTPRRRSVSVEVERTVEGTTVKDLITDVNRLNVFSFPRETYVSYTEDVIQERFNFNDEVKSWTFSKALLGASLVRDSSTVDGGVLEGTVQTTIEYIEPLHPHQITFIDHDDILNDGLTYSPYFI